MIAAICTSLALTGGIDQTTKDARKVEHLLRTVEMHHPRTGDKELAAEVTESELDAYIAYRLAQEKNPLIKRLKVDLLDNNQIEGKIGFDAEHLNLGLLLGKNLDFDFKGILNTRNGWARMDLTALALNGQSVKPQVLDLVLGAAARYNGNDSGRISDWYELPKGIKRVIVTKGRAVLYY